MEKFIEISVPRKNNLKDTLTCFAVSILPMLVGSYILMLTLNTKSGSLLPLALLACVGLCFVGYKLFCLFTIEWEYTLVDTELRFSKIINKSRRRDVVTVNLSKVEIIAKVNDSNNNHALKNFTGKKISMISQTNTDYFYMITTTQKGERVCIFFEPDERMLENFKTTARGKIYM